MIYAFEKINGKPTYYYEWHEKKADSDIEVPQMPGAFYDPVFNEAGEFVEWKVNLDAWAEIAIRPFRNEYLNEIDLVYCNAEKWELYSPEEKAAWRKVKQFYRDLPKTAEFEQRANEFSFVPPIDEVYKTIREGESK